MFNLLSAATLNIALAVACGAFGAHGLKKIATLEQITWWQTGTLYFLIHAIGLVLLAVLALIPKHSLSVALPFDLMQLGIVIFAGSLYAMALGAPKWFGAITPIGGLLLIAAWLNLAWQARLLDSV